MRRRYGVGVVLTLAVVSALAAAAPRILGSAHLHWPAWPFLIVTAILLALAAPSKPVTDAIMKAWASRTGHQIRQGERARQIEHELSGNPKGLSRVREAIDAGLLGVHPSIPLSAHADTSLSPDLPLYVPRDIDAELHKWITEHREKGGFLLLAGPPAAGKTRCAYELIVRTLPDWRILSPATPSQLTDYVQAIPARRKLLVWLDEIQNFLGPGGLTADTTRRLLSCRKPVIIIVATIWPKDYDSLTTLADTISAPTSGIVTQKAASVTSPSTDAREILIKLARRWDLLPGFTEAEYERTRHLAARDPRLAEALELEESPNVPETLAAAPALISRWLNGGDAYGAAVITAAVTARRCGHPEPLPPGILEALAQANLTPEALAHAGKDWFQAALTWARQPVRGEAAPLTPQSRTPGTVDGDHVSDILVQHALRNGNAPWSDIPYAIWQLLIDHASPGACLDIADAAHSDTHAHAFRIAERASRKAADTGDGVALFNLGGLEYDQGNTTEAELWWRKAWKAGQPDAMSNIGVLFSDQGNTTEAARAYRAAAKAGSTDAMNNLGKLYHSRARTRDAEKWWRKAAKEGHPEAMFNLGVLFQEEGSWTEAIQWWHSAAENGYTPALFNLGNIYNEQGNATEAEKWWRRAADSNIPEGMSNLGLLLHRQGNYTEAEQWYLKAVESGYGIAMFNLANLYHEQGSEEKAEHWWREAAKTGHPDAAFNVGIICREQGHMDEAERWWHESAKTGNVRAMNSLGNLRCKQKNLAEAEQWWYEAAKAGHATSMLNLADLLEDQNKIIEAEQWRRKAAEFGNDPT